MELPGADLIQLRTPQPSMDIAHYPGNPGAVGQAIEKVGGAIEDRQFLDNQFNYAKARSDYLVGKTDLLSKIQDDPNWQTADKSYLTGMQKLQANTVTGITDQRLQKRFQMEAGMDLKSGLSSVLSFQRGKEKDQGRGDLVNSLESLRQSALANPNDSPAMIATAQSLFDGAKTKGYITDYEAVNMKHKWLQDYGRGYADMQIDANPAAAATMLGNSLPAKVATPSRILSALQLQESGGRPNSPTSVDGAVGPGQITPATFAQYAKPGEKIDDPQDNEAVMRRIVDDYSSRPGWDAGRVATAYFSGPGNVAPPNSPTPYLKDYKDGNGKSVSSYVSDVVNRLGGSEQITAPKTGTPLDFMDPADRASLHHLAIDRAESENSVENIAQKHRAEAAANGVVQQLLTDPTKVNVMDIANNPDLKAEQKWQLSNMTKAALADLQGGDTTKTLGPGFWNVYKSVTAPPGTPNRITDPSQLLPLAGPGGSLSLEGVDKLTKILSGKGTPSGEAESEMQKQFFANAKHQISGSDEGLHLHDPKGDELYLKFLGHAFPAIADAKAKGLTPAQIYNPDSPEYVGKSISTFKRPMAQWTADMMNDVGGGGGGQQASQNLNNLADIVAQVRAGKMSRADGIALANKRGFLASDQKPVPLPQLPPMGQ